MSRTFIPWTLAALIAGCGGGGGGASVDDFCRFVCNEGPMCNGGAADPACPPSCARFASRYRSEFAAAFFPCAESLSCTGSLRNCETQASATLPHRSLDDQFATRCAQRSGQCPTPFSSTVCTVPTAEFQDQYVTAALQCFDGPCDATQTCIDQAFGKGP